MQKLNWKSNGKLEKAGIKIVRLLTKQGYKAFWVGGIVRNILLGKESDNLDIATSALPDEVQRILKKASLKTKEIGKKFGTILTIVNGQKVEITTFRSEGFYSDKRHPDKIEFITDFVKDSQRRDLTINAIYFDPITGKLFDPAGGLKDMQAKLIRFVGNPKKRIDEDALRLLRAVRFATQLDFKLERNSFAAIKTRAKYIQDVSGERIKIELDNILMSGKASRGIQLLDDTGVLKFLIPETQPLKKFFHKSKLYHLEGSMFTHTLLVLEQSSNTNLDLNYALLFHDIAKPLVAHPVLKDEGLVMSTKGHADVGADVFLKFAKKFKFSRQSTKNIEWLIRNHMLSSNFYEMRLAKQIRLAAHPSFGLLIEHWKADHNGIIRKSDFDLHSKQYDQSVRTAKSLLIKIERSKPLIKKLVRGELIMKHYNLKPGVAFGRKIEDIKTHIILGKIKNVKDLKGYLNT